jgi:hypothetical protein
MLAQPLDLGRGLVANGAALIDIETTPSSSRIGAEMVVMLCVAVRQL